MHTKLTIPCPPTDSKVANPYFGIDTDDNPETTLKGTGFKDVETANKTIELVSKRSLTCKHSSLSLAFGPVNLSSADDICFGPLNYPTPWRPPGQVVCILRGSTVCVECSEKGGTRTVPQLYPCICHGHNSVVWTALD